MGACIEHKKDIISTKHLTRNRFNLEENNTNQMEKNIHFKQEDFIKSSIYNTKNELKASNMKNIQNNGHNNNPIVEHKNLDLIGVRLKKVK
jgi:hypothetical protein